MGNSRDDGRTLTHESGVYMLLHVPTDSGYVGSSQRSIYNRWSWHKTKLKHEHHPCAALQALWSATDPSEWEFVILEEDENNDIRQREEFWMDLPTVLLNSTRNAMGAGRVWTEEQKQKARESRARYLETPGARESLADRARAQHAAGKLGRRTWRLH